MPTPLKGQNVTNVSNLTSFPYDTSSPPPFGLAAWSGNPSAIGLAIDTDLTRHIFYVGTDRTFHSVASFAGVTESGWRPQPSQGVNVWPLADAAESDFAIASDLGTSTIRLYYESGGSMVEARYNDGNWEDAAVLLMRNTTASPNASTPRSDTASSGLSTGAKVGIGVSVPLGVLIAGGAAWLLRRKRHQADEENTADAGSTAGDRSTPGYHSGPPMAAAAAVEVGRPSSAASHPGKWETDVKEETAPELDNPTPVRELDGPNRATELPEILGSHELPSDRHIVELA